MHYLGYSLYHRLASLSAKDIDIVRNVHFILYLQYTSCILQITCETYERQLKERNKKQNVAHYLKLDITQRQLHLPKCKRQMVT